MNTDILRIPLYKLYYIDDLEDFSGLTEQELEMLKSEYDEAILKNIIEGVNWATNNPKYDFQSLLPDLQYSNEDIYKYLCKVNTSMNSL